MEKGDHSLYHIAFGLICKWSRCGFVATFSEGLGRGQVPQQTIAVSKEECVWVWRLLAHSQCNFRK